MAYIPPSTPVISTANSTSATLTSGSVFTGTSEDVTSYREMRVSVFADVASATNGFSLQQSTDNVNWDILDTYTIPAGTGKTYTVPKSAKYFRVVYTNGGSNQTAFRLQAILNPGSASASSQRAADGYTNETDLEQHQAFNMVWNGTTWDRLPGTTAGTKTVLTNGTNVADVVANDTGYNGLVSNNGMKVLPFTTSVAGAQTLLANTDTRGYSSVAVVLTSAGSGLAWNGMWSPNSGGTYLASSAWTASNSVGNNAGALGISTTIWYEMPVRLPYFQLAITALTSGTVSGYIVLATLPHQSITMGVAATQSGTWTVGANSATGSAVPANAYYVGVSDGTSLRGVLGAANALNSTGAGVQAAQMVGQFDDVSPTAITENQFGNVRMSTNRNLYGTIRDAAGNERGANVNASSQLSVSVDNSPVLGAGAALVGKVGIDQTTPGTTNAVVDTAVTTGGLSIITGSVGATATAIKASAGQLYGYHLFNTTAATAYVQIFNVAAGSVTLGTTAPAISIGIPASGGATVNFDKGIAFGTAMSFACTTTRAGLTGATCDVNFFYK